MSSKSPGSDGKSGAVLVVGGGIGGMQAALDLAESGFKVYLLDNKPSIGGVMAQLDKTFPTNDCAMCTMAPRLVEIGRHKDIKVITLADVEKLEGQPGRFKATVRRRPRFVREDKCTGCGQCMANCPVRNEIYIVDEEETAIDVSPEDRVRIDEILHEHHGESGALVSILQSVNSVYNYLPENILRHLSRQLHVPLSLIYRIASFYAAFSLTPRGKHIVTVCTGTACHVKGAPRVMRALEKELGIRKGETTDDMNFTLEAVRCLGCCGLAPVMTVGKDLYGHVSESKVAGILSAYKNS
ncbi:MAG: NAD(P)H-dependent oxidoreductase subunit E [bacterium]|nr:NAD(P)H-dependent oxidoreductase subunit E [bacterium]